MSLKNDTKKLVEKAARQGWRVDDRGSRWLLFSPDGVTIVTIHKTPSDHRTIANTVAQLRKGGFDSRA